MKKPQAASKLLKINKKGSALYNTLAFAHYLRTLEQIVTRYLPPSFSQHFQVSSYEYGKLVILCDSASWSSKLRFHTRHLILKLKNHSEFSEINTISTLTNLRSITKVVKRHLPKPKKISLEYSELLIETAKMEDDKTLSEALQRLAKHACISTEESEK
ncbi:MAG: DUF721 domain-containing protein [Pseudomonadales bacterium]|nr:DUF721 domain-containing protein [Pseudomonadales bacterium]